MTPPGALGVRAILAVGVGGALGALARWGVDVAVEAAGRPIPLATLAVNLGGCLLMGLLVAAVLGHPRRHPLWRPFLGVGVLGGFTTFSAFAGDVLLILRDGHPATALAYLLASVAGALIAVWLGYVLGQLGRRRVGGAAPLGDLGRRRVGGHGTGESS